jgi:hypothetical protein
MDPIREGIVRFVDKTSFTFQNVFQIFGFLPDGRELLEVDQTEEGQTVTFSDRTEEGWAGFSLNIPANASLSHATAGFLSRSAIWWVRSDPDAVVAHVWEKNEGYPRPKRKSRRVGAFHLEDNVEVQIGGSDEKGVTILVVTQSREPDALADAMKARSRAFKDHRG